ncbi:MAG: SDR family oxidoreductase, partial [Gammaproteobacteria bacterium]|nr:SDR family oxidoreductase [Gammaproteobacteria bacterium]
MSGKGKALLITGAGGYLGAGLAARALAESERPVILWLHARSRAELEEKSSRLAAVLGADGARAAFRGGDLSSDEPFADIEPHEIGAIVHAAAVTRFNVEREAAEAVNVNGARRLFELAARCPALDHLLLLSSVYAAGLRGGCIAETPLAEPPAFANHYEWSKWRAERTLVDEHGC